MKKIKSIIRSIINLISGKQPDLQQSVKKWYKERNKILVLIAIVLGLSTANAQTKPYPLDKVTQKITFIDTIKTALDSITATNKINDYLLTNLADVKPNANKTYCKGKFDAHRKAMGGGLSKQTMGSVDYSLITEIHKGYITLTRTNFQFIGGTVDNPLNPTFGNKIKIKDRPLEESKVNQDEVWQVMGDQKALFNRLLN